MSSAISSDYFSGRFPGEVEVNSGCSRDLFFQAIENSDGVPYQLVFGQNGREDFYLNVGNGINQLLGVTQSEFTGNLLQRMTEEIIPLGDGIPSDPVKSREKIKNGEIQKYRAEVLLTTPSGEKKWLRDCSVPVIDDKTGKPTGLLGIYFDITKQKQALIQLEKALERASESDRLKTAFLNNLPHEIRTPLNAIVGFTTLLNEPGQISDNRMEFQDIITHSSDHLLEIVDDILEISKIEAKIVKLIKKEVDIKEMLLRLYNRFKPAAEEKNILLKYDPNINPIELVITTDGYKLFQSLSNLLSNAVKFTFEGEVEFGCTMKEDKIDFYVSDTGIGIAQENKLNIFKPFFQARSSGTMQYEGTGLGLSIAKAYIELLGGKIWFCSEPGGGSVFYFNIPYLTNQNDSERPTLRKESGSK